MENGKITLLLLFYTKPRLAPFLHCIFEGLIQEAQLFVPWLWALSEFTES